tara:strand:- start:587 stop:2695 length:2109 start_codon:yes stop_codon:yes gene_type:complete
MQIIEIYIEGQRAEMFDFEGVTITDTIKDVRDINKVFTEYSQTFSLPASKVNNKIFKHYYNNSITNGFDARIRVPCKLQLNSIPFKSGYIKLEGVDLKNNVAHSYRITFFGNTISLKNLLGDDLLSSLSIVPEGEVSLFNELSKKANGTPLLYNSSDIEDYLTSSQNRSIGGVTYNNPIQVPLITHSERLTYDSNTSADVAGSGDVHYHTGGGQHIKGVKWNELKFAVKLKIIIKSIENKYGINFSSDFFDNDASFQDLYMWLHRTKGSISTGSLAPEYKSFVDSWSNYSGSISSMQNNSLTLYTAPAPDVLSLEIMPNSSDLTKQYSVTVFQSGSVVYQSTTAAGNRSFTIPRALYAGYTVQVTSTQILSFDRVRWFVRRFPNDLDTFDAVFNVEDQFVFNIQEQIPKMKVLDFLTSIFRMFNLVAYIQNDEIVVKKLDMFYSNAQSYDITKYVDTNSSQTNTALPFREILFTYQGLGTFLAKKHNQLFNKEWGKEEYKGTTESGDSLTIFSGGIYNYTIPFEHMKFERLIDLSTSNLTDIQYGYCVDDNQSSYIGKPIIFYMDLKTLPTGGEISFVDIVNSSNQPTSHKAISSYYTPANSDLKYSQVEDRQSLNFSSEPDEWEFTINNETLFNNYHKKYISSVFNESNRLTKITAYLPLQVLYKYTLADRFVMSGKSYKINSIETDFYTGKSEIQLLSDI